MEMLKLRARAHGQPYPPPDTPDPEKAYAAVGIDEFMADMDEAGIDKALVVGFDVTRIWESTSSSESVASFVKKYPEKLMGLGSVSPIDSKNRFNKSSLKDLERAVDEYGLLGIKLAPTYCHYYPDDAKIYPLYEKAEELNAIVMFHQGGTFLPNAPLKYAHPSLLDEVAADFPDLKIVIAHMGDPWYDETVFMLQKHPNVYADISALCGRPTTLAFTLAKAKEAGRAAFGKLFFGTDYPGVCRPRKNYVKWLKTDLRQIMEKAGWSTLREEEIDALLGKNAISLLEKLK